MICPSLDVGQLADAIDTSSVHLAMCTNEEGARVRVEVLRRVRNGGIEDGRHTIHLVVAYKGRPLEILEGKAAIEVGPLPKLPTLIDSLIEAVRAGELDSAIATAAAEQGQLLNRN